MVEPQNKKSITAILKKAAYLGLSITDPIDKILQLITLGLDQILTSDANAESAKTLLDIINQNRLEDNDVYGMPWRYPKDHKEWHVTTYFKKGKISNFDDPIFVTFEEGKKINIQVKALILVLGKIITSVIFTDVPVKNEFPHMTTLLGTYAPKNSNDVCMELFGPGKQFEKEYKQMKDNEVEGGAVYKVNVELLGKNEVAYVCILAQPFTLETEMKAFSY
jgi:hypothetical protein